MSNLRCQTCHRQQFASFADGHPDFSPAYPMTRPTRIIFNHETHYNGYFEAKDWRGNCRSCHKPDQTSAHMLTDGFDTACGNCHSAQIRGSVTVFALPTLDTYTLDEEKIGVWPDIEDYVDEDIPLSPFMILLLSADEAVAGHLKTIGDLDVLLELDEEDEEVVEAARRLAWAIKGLIYDLLEGEEQALAERLRKVFGRDLSRTEIEALTGIQSADAPWSENLKRLQEHFLEGLADQVQGHRANPNDSPSEHEEPDESKQAERRTSLGESGWFFDKEMFAVDYRLVGHADPFLRAWLDRTAAAAPAEAAAAADTTTGSAKPGVFEELFEELSGMGLDLEPPARSAPGRCIKCHSIDSIASGGIERFRVNWTALRPTHDERLFTKFVHRPHLMTHNCIDCHTMFDDGDDRESSSESDWGIDFKPGFHPITKNDCAQCHTAGGSGDSCILCHNYHVSMTSLVSPHLTK